MKNLIRPMTNEEKDLWIGKLCQEVGIDKALKLRNESIEAIAKVREQ